MTSPSKSKPARQTMGQFLLPCLSFILALVVFFFPIQHYASMGRYQHYGLAIFIWGMGYVLHAIWTWRNAGPWSRWSYVVGGLYLTSLGMMLYANPWLEPKVAMHTDDQAIKRFWISMTYTFLTVPTTLMWVAGLFEELRE
jgi:hypothetical protein